MGFFLLKDVEITRNRFISPPGTLSLLMARHRLCYLAARELTAKQPEEAKSGDCLVWFGSKLEIWHILIGY
jgi:hypothetical protein